MTHQQWDGLADAVNPVFLCIFLACALAWLPNPKRARFFLFRSGLALLCHKLRTTAGWTD